MTNYDYLSLSVIRWTTMTNVRAEKVVERFVKMNISRDKENNLLSDMKDRLSVLEASSFLFLIISFLVNLFLFVGIYFPERDVSILEISSKDLASVKEVSVFFASSVLMGSSMISFNAGVLAASLRKMYFLNHGRDGELAAENLIPGNIFGRESENGLYNRDMFLLSPIRKLFSVFPIFLILFIVTYTCFSIFVQVCIIGDLIKNPTTDEIFSLSVVFYSVICGLCFLFMTICHQVPLPFTKYNTKLFEYVRGLGQIEFDKYIVSSIAWEGRPRLINFLIFAVSMNAVGAVFFMFIYRLVVNQGVGLQLFSIIIGCSLMFSVALAAVMWRSGRTKYIERNRGILERFDSKYYTEWASKDQSTRTNQ